MQKKIAKRKDEVFEELDETNSSNDEETTKSSPSKKKIKLSKSRDKLKILKSAKYTKQPTVEELNRLRETENLFSSNFFRLQIDEVLKEVVIKSKHTTAFEKWLIDLNKFISNLKDIEIKHENDEIQLPILLNPRDVSETVSTSKFSPAEIIGSFKYGGILGPDFNVNLKIDLNKNVLSKSDLINEKCLRKKALCLKYLSSELSKCELIQSVKYILLNESNYQPALLLKPAGKLGTHVNVTLQFCYEADFFKMHKFTPHKNNVRKRWRLNLDTTPEDDCTIPTPRYNSAILNDLTCDLNNHYLENALKECENIKNGIILLKIWLRQRQITSFSGFIMSMFVVYLMKSKRINNSMSSYQIIRNVWTSLASSVWDSNGISLFSSDPSINHPLVDDFHGFYPVVFIDVSGYNNLCSGLSLDAYKDVCNESKLAIDFLDSQGSNGFIPLFMKPVIFHLKYDHILRIDYSKFLDAPMKKRLEEQVHIDMGLALRPAIVDLLYEVLMKGLGDRVTSLTLKSIPSEDQTWEINEKALFKSVFTKPIIFGIKLNPERAFDFIDKGPPANLPEAEIFREFWGQKSTLRRFQDGSIAEACIWNTDHTLASKRLIIKEIIFHLLQSKLGIEKKIHYLADQFDSILKNHVIEPANFKYGTAEEASMALSSSLDSLMQNLRNLNNMPLDIHSIQGTSSVFSFTDPLPPIPVQYSKFEKKDFEILGKYRLFKSDENTEDNETIFPMFIPTLKVIVQLSQSGKWPDKIEALRKIKAAFNIQISKTLETQFSLTSYPRQEFVDVIKNGYVFRIEVAHRKEIVLLREIVETDGVTKYRDCEESLKLEERTTRLPRIRMALNGLYHQNNCYGSATCLLKRWIRAHMIDSYHFPDICIDLLVASLFLKSEPYSAPHQPQVAFWRSLSLLANTDWNTHLIILNFNDDLTNEEITSLETTFMTSRETLPPMYIVTPYDGNRPSVWTKPHPTIQILARLQVLAKEALNMIDTIVVQNPLDITPSALFVTNIEGYDVLIKIKSELNPLSQYHHSNIDSVIKPKKSRPYNKTDDEIIPIVDFDPVQLYLEQLRLSYDDFALFFHDTYGGNTIGLLWKPSIFETKEFKTSVLNGRKLIERNGKQVLVTDVDAILEGILILGDGIVEEIENKTNVTV